MKLIRRLHRNGTTIIMISHDADILGEYAQRILVLDKGKLRLAAPVKEIFKDIARMEALNLDVSRPRKIAHMLLKKGISFPQDITGYGELLGAIKKLKEGCLIS
jgi:energy-coupling factor transporter ATP-binding protein EcfA2